MFLSQRVMKKKLEIIFDRLPAPSSSLCSVRRTSTPILVSWNAYS